jgi:ketosteroid isomerase-like protein
VDVRRGGVLEHSFPLEGPKSGLVELQNKAAEDLLAAFHINLTPDRRQVLFASRTTGTADSYKGLYDSLPVAEEADQPTSQWRAPSERPQSFASGIAVARAEEPVATEKAAIAALLQQYREALETKNVERCAELQVDMNDRQRDSLRRYFDNAENLRVRISDEDITVRGDEAVATFTRTDQFKEAPTGRDVQLEVRLSGLLAKQDGHWKIRGLKKPS